MNAIGKLSKKIVNDLVKSLGLELDELELAAATNNVLFLLSTPLCKCVEPSVDNFDEMINICGKCENIM